MGVDGGLKCSHHHVRRAPQTKPPPPSLFFDHLLIPFNLNIVSPMKDPHAPQDWSKFEILLSL